MLLMMITMYSFILGPGNRH